MFSAGYAQEAGSTRGRRRGQSLIRDRLAAIAEPGRFEMCRHLLGEPITTSELAVRMGISEPQVSGI
ncbi:hypothetical protein AB0L00_15255 [Actinoallomurus sp. NPDC052308]|uniref:hypothetical protein n=1 Tax=Actinoallomurus sp. NPDC052308 TaxID=3155530 RepID=UPI003442FCF7